LEIGGHPLFRDEQRQLLQILEFLDALIGVRDEDLRLFWNIAATASVGILFSTASKPCSVLALMKKSMRPAGSRTRLFTFGPPGRDGDVESVFAVGAVGERLIEAAMLGLRHPIGAERHLVESLRVRRTGESRH